MNEHQKVFYILYISIYFLFQPQKDSSTTIFKFSHRLNLLLSCLVCLSDKIRVMIGQIACQSSSREGSIDPKIY